MTKTLKLSLLAVAVMTLAACQKEAAEPEVKLTSDVEKQSYGIGVQIAGFIKKDFEQKKEAGVELNPELVIAGMKAEFAGKSVLKEEEVQELLTKLETDFRAKQQEIAQKKADETKAAGAAFMADNAKREGVKTTESGIQYEVLTAAEGAKPTAEDTVKVHYKGTLIDGTEFDSSYSRNEPATFPLSHVIKGWTEGVQLMNVGSKFKFTIPSDLAYGERAIGNIPANSTLVFEVELLDIVKEDAAKADETK